MAAQVAMSGSNAILHQSPWWLRTVTVFENSKVANNICHAVDSCGLLPALASQMIPKDYPSPPILYMVGLKGSMMHISNMSMCMT
jgi:hypothetical protein